jgi:hypothetical protein
MQRRQAVIAVLGALVALAGCQGITGSGPEDIESTFDDGAQGWAITGDAQDGSAAPTHNAEGGDSGGYLSADDDVTGGVWFWAAPDRYLGDRSDYEGGTLSFALTQSATDSGFEDRDVVMASESTELVYRFDAPPGTDWTDYEVELSPAGWTDSETGDPATDEQLQLVLAEVERLWIRGEYRSGADTGGLDTVVLSGP